MNGSPPNHTAPEPPAPSSPASPQIALIAAVARNGVIGVDNRLPWHLPEDLRLFRQLTRGRRVVMGRKTCESLPGPLPGRENVVLTRHPGMRANGFRFVSSVAESLAGLTRPGPIFCIGGAEIYAQFLPFAHLFYLTRIGRDYPGDAVFPAVRWSQWRKVAEKRRRLVDRESGSSQLPLALAPRGERVDRSDAFTYHLLLFERVHRPEPVDTTRQLTLFGD